MSTNTNWHAHSVPVTLAALHATAQGLTAVEAEARLRQHGPNQLTAAQSDGALLLLWRQINNPISWVLVAAGVLAVVLAKPTDALVVFGAVVINAIIGFVQESRASKAIEALSAMVPLNATVLRDGSHTTVPAHALVPGDIVRLQSGDKVPADLRLLTVSNLQVEEAALTGESVPVAKQLESVAPQAVIGDRTCLSFGGTLVTRGMAMGVVVETGDRTELGRINQMLKQTGNVTTPLTRQLAVVSTWITIVVVAISLAIAGYGYLAKGAKLGESLMTGLTLAVAAIPEGLPAIITIALAIGVRRMAARHAIVRHLPAVETLGSTTVICSDKTGTLTRNEMTVQGIWCGGRTYLLSGIGYDPAGTLIADDRPLADIPAEVHDLVEASVLCNDAALQQRNGQWVIIGDPTEAAMVVAGRKLGFGETDLRSGMPRLDVIPFESDTKFMATLHRGGGRSMVILKGAPEVILSRCVVDPAVDAQIRTAQHAFAAQGMRVLAVASREVDAGSDVLDPAWAASGHMFLGLLAMIDPPRQEAINAIAACHRAGIIVKMITGDHHVTAAAIGKQLGIVTQVDQAMTGTQLDQLSDAELRLVAKRCHVFARVAPEHKIRLVTALQADGHVVAMTGDGVNDAPALKRADIGIAMGITGTEVSKDAAKIVLADDNFASIAAAVEEGRRVYDNLIKALAFILPTNLGLALILAGGMFFFPTIEVDGLGRELLLPMSPTQILWVNLIASVALSIPIAFEVLDRGSMQRPPRRRDAPIFSRFVLVRTIAVAILMAVAACLLFLWEYYRTVGPVTGDIASALHASALAEAQTIAVTSVIMFQIFYLLHCRSLTNGLGSLGWFTNPIIWLGIGALLMFQAGFVYVPFMQALFGTTGLSFEAWMRLILAASIVLPLISIEKWLWRRLAQTCTTRNRDTKELASGIQT